MNPNQAFLRKKMKIRQSGFHVWECQECGWKQNLFGTVIDGHKWLIDHPYCKNCGTQHSGPDGWDCIS